MILAAVVAGGLGLLAVAALLGLFAWDRTTGAPGDPGRLAAWRRASHAKWVGLDDLDDEELSRVISMRYVGGWEADAARDRILRRRALLEQVRRTRLRGRRAKGGARRRPLP